MSEKLETQTTCELNKIKKNCFKEKKVVNLFMEDVISNALINQIEVNRKCVVSIVQAEAYINDVKKDLETKGYDVNLVLSRNHTIDFEENYSDYFYKFSIEGCKYYGLDYGKTTNDLYSKFRGVPQLEVIESLVDVEIIEKHFGIKEYKIKRLGK